MGALADVRRSPLVRHGTFALRRGRTRLIEHVLGIDTTTVPTAIERTTVHADPVHYEPMDYALLRRYLGPLHLTSSDVVFDIGCGLGRMLCVLARRRVAKCVGIEVSAPLAEGARRNLRRLRGRTAPAVVATADACRADYDEGTVFIMYNPFGAKTVAATLARIRASVEARPRPVRLAYFHPVHEDVLADSGWLRLAARRRSPFFQAEATYWESTLPGEGAVMNPAVVARAWGDLHDRSAPRTIDTTFAWVRAWLALDASRGDLAPRVVAAWSGGRMVAALPLQLTAGPLGGALGGVLGPRARPVGFALDGAHGAVTDPGDADAADALARALRRDLPPGTLVVIDDVLATDTATSALARAVERGGGRATWCPRTVSHVIDLPARYDDYLSAVLSSKSRYNLRREARRLTDAHDVTVARHDGPAIDAAVLDRIAAVEAESWLRRHGAPAAGRGPGRALVGAAADADAATAWILSVDGDDAAFVVALRAGRHLSYKWTAFKERHAASSVGKMLTGRVIADACTDGIRTLDFGLGDAAYKSFWSTRRVAVSRLALGFGARAAVAARAWRAAHRVARHRAVRSVITRLRAHRG